MEEIDRSSWLVFRANAAGKVDWMEYPLDESSRCTWFGRRAITGAGCFQAHFDPNAVFLLVPGGTSRASMATCSMSTIKVLCGPNSFATIQTNIATINRATPSTVDSSLLRHTDYSKIVEESSVFQRAASDRRQTVVSACTSLLRLAAAENSSHSSNLEMTKTATVPHCYVIVEHVVTKKLTFMPKRCDVAVAVAFKMPQAKGAKILR